MAVATAAATVMASNAERARPRRKMAARNNIRQNMEVCAEEVLRSATAREASVLKFRSATRSLD